ncbi:MAG: UDP-N-acetylmuramate dehydrogenase [Bacillota bacterium]
MRQWQEKAAIILSGIPKKFDIPMAELTTFKIGGPLDLLVEPREVPELEMVINFCAAEKIPWMVLGLGSNLLVRDKGIRGVGIKLSGEFNRWEAEEGKVTAGAGMALADLAKATACLGLTGLEFACGIPGTVGGGVYMNAGAYEGEIAQVLAGVQAFDQEKGVVWYGKADLPAGYRYSRFQENRQIIIKALFQLKTVEKETAVAKIAELTCKRESKQPLEMPSAGSVFRRPAGFYVGPLIEEAGLKGFTLGGAQVSPKHAGFIVNAGNATAQDVLSLISHIQRVIKEKNGVDLTPEIRVVGEE